MRLHALALSLFCILAFDFGVPARAVHENRDALAAMPAVRQVSRPAALAPEDVLGFRPGDDRKLASWGQTVEYFRRLAAASDRVRFEEIGRSTMDAPFVLATISAPENLARLDEYREIQRQLADPRLIGRDRDRRATALISRGKTVVLITCGVHSTEVGSYLSSMLIAHRLATSTEPDVLAILQNCIVLLVPSLNPDGVDIVKNWYDRTIGTPFEGTDPPEIYNKYTGHDDNRDWYAFTQLETQLTVDRIHNVWHPQIVHDIHQQGIYTSRLFLPPYMAPVEPNVPRQIVEAYTELGRAMEADLRGRGFRGITTASTYDAWTPGRAYSHYHGGVRILSETASCKLASPVTVRRNELRPGLGYDARRASPNFPDPWPGGEWRLRDITNYMTSAAFSLLNHAAQHRREWLSRFFEIANDAVRPRRPGDLYAFLVPPAQNSGRLLDILQRGGVEVVLPERLTVNGVKYPKDTAVILMSQPYGSFAKALLERQHYPDLRDPEGRPVRPYDVTAHTLSLLLNVPMQAVYSPFRLVPPKPEGGRGSNGGCGEANPPRRAVYRSYVPSMDEGWTRWVMDNRSNCLFYTSIVDRDVRAGNLRARFDTIIIPDETPDAILEGHRPGTMPPEYTGGLGEDGIRALSEFVNDGGTLVCLNRASDFAIDQFRLPVHDVTKGLRNAEYYAPGSILRTEVDTTLPVARGMPRESIAWVESSPVFELAGASQPPLARVVVRYPSNVDPLLSGWLLGGDRVRGKAAMVEVRMGRGRIYLFGFRPQYRGQSEATYPLFFNAIR